MPIQRIDDLAIEIQLTASVSNLIVTTSTNRKSITQAILTNTSILDVEVTLWRLNIATTETTGSGGNWFFKDTIPSGLSIIVRQLIGTIIDSNQKLSGLAATAGVINFNGSGFTETET